MNLRSILKLLLLIFCLLLAKVKGLKQKPSILMYHSFDTSGWRYGVSPENIEKQLKYLLRYYEIVKLEDIQNFAEGKSNVSDNAVAITVDDGYEDTYKVFYPLAKRYNIPFIIFLTTDLLVKPDLGNLPRPKINQLREMSESGLVTFGLHGHSHIHFTKVFDEEQMQGEIVESEKIIEDLAGESPKFVAYPSGRYNDKVLEHFRSDPKYVGGLTTHSGFIKRGDDVQRLRRIEVSRNIDSFILFKLRLTPALDLYNKIIRLLK